MLVTFFIKIIDIFLSSFREGTGSLASLVDTPHQTRTVELLIINVKVGLSFLCSFAAIVLCIFINYLYLFCYSKKFVLGGGGGEIHVPNTAEKFSKKMSYEV